MSMNNKEMEAHVKGYGGKTQQWGNDYDKRTEREKMDGVPATPSDPVSGGTLYMTGAQVAAQIAGYHGSKK